MFCNRVLFRALRAAAVPAAIPAIKPMKTMAARPRAQRPRFVVHHGFLVVERVIEGVKDLSCAYGSANGSAVVVGYSYALVPAGRLPEAMGAP